MLHSRPKAQIASLVYSIVVFGILVIISFRTIGLDYQSYLREYNDPSIVVSAEVGYRTLIYALSFFAPFTALLALANITFFISHRDIWKAAINPSSVLCISAYVAYIGIFLLLGSPRRLIAYSLVTPIIISIATGKKPGLSSLWRVLLAATFHTSAIIAVTYYFTSTTIPKLFDVKPKRALALTLLLAATAAISAYAGLIDFIAGKIYYYAVYSASEQDYISEVPSIWAGLIKRAVVISLLLCSVSPRKSHFIQVGYRIITIDVILYTAGSLISPVIAVVSSYFVIGYLLVAIHATILNTNQYRKLCSLMACAIFFLPTAYGLVRIFPKEFGL